MCKTIEEFIRHLQLVASQGLANQLKRIFDEEIKAAERRGAKWMRDMVVEEILKECDACHNKRPEMNEWFRIYQEGGAARDKMLENDTIMCHLDMQGILIDSYPLSQEEKIALDEMLSSIVAMHMANHQNKEI